MKHLLLNINFGLKTNPINSSFLKVMLLVGLSFFTSCISEKPSSSRSTGYAPAYKEAGTDKDGNSKEPEDARKMIYNATLHMTVDIPDTLNNRLVQIAKKYKGYVQTIGTTETKIRVQSRFLNDAIAAIQGEGKLTEKYLHGEDVTEQYQDYQIRLENAEKSRKRYLELLDKAQNVGDILQIEKEVARLNGEIEMLKGKMQRIDHLDEYSTITVYIKERKKPGLLGYVFLYSYKVVKWLFVRN